MSRELCVFENFDLTMVPLNKRKYALSKQVSAYSPFKNFSYTAKWFDGWAAVWIWDQNLQSDAASKIKKKKNSTICAEPSLLPTQEDGIFGYKSDDGFFVQLWRERKLVSEISWRTEPSAQEVNEFAQLNGEDYYSDSIEWHEVEFNFSVSQLLISEPERIMQLILGLSLSVFFVFFTYQLLSLGRLEIELRRLDGNTQEIRKEKADVVDLRSDAVALRDFNQKAQALKKPKQLEFMSVLAKNLQEEKSNLIEWDFDGSRIRANFADTNNSVSKIVERLEGTGKFASISVDIDSVRNRVALTMEIDGEI